MRKIIITLLILLSMLTISVSASEEMVINGDFETGDFTGWSYSGDVDVANFGAGHETVGRLKIYGSTGVRYFEQSIDVTDVDEITFYSWFDGSSSGSAYARVLFDGQQKYYWTHGNSHGWTARSIDVSSLSGNKTLRFEGVFNSGNSITAGFDDVSAITAGAEYINTLYVALSDQNRHSYINISGYEGYTFYYNELLDWTIEQYNPDYTYFINCTTNNASISYDYEKILDTGDSFQKTIHERIGNKVNIPYPSTKTSYTFHLYEVQNKPSIPWYMFFLQPVSYVLYLMEGDKTPIELDTITVWLGAFTETEEPDVTTPSNPVPNPSPSVNEPIPNFPDYNPPSSNPGNPVLDENATYQGSLNTTFLSGYYSTIDNTVNSVANPINNTVSYVLSPIRSLSNTIEETSIKFTLYQPDNSFIISLLKPFFNGLPMKLQIFISFQLIMMLILLIFNR